MFTFPPHSSSMNTYPLATLYVWNLAEDCTEPVLFDKVRACRVFSFKQCLDFASL